MSFITLYELFVCLFVAYMLINTARFRRPGECMGTQSGTVGVCVSVSVSRFVHALVSDIVSVL